jgi:hypothetical protein
MSVANYENVKRSVTVTIDGMVQEQNFCDGVLISSSTMSYEAAEHMASQFLRAAKAAKDIKAPHLRPSPRGENGP